MPSCRDAHRYFQSQVQCSIILLICFSPPNLARGSPNTVVLKGRLGVRKSSCCCRSKRRVKSACICKVPPPFPLPK
ncbi:hypothetical protein H112_03837 [Trichophyton rubrum D6]|nr:hypothetical protein H112_03837 [Trichophyton rubrum D6]